MKLNRSTTHLHHLLTCEFKCTTWQSLYPYTGEDPTVKKNNSNDKLQKYVVLNLEEKKNAMQK